MNSLLYSIKMFFVAVFNALKRFFTGKSDKRNYIIVPLLIVIIALILIFDSSANNRIAKAFVDLWNSFAYFFKTTFTGNEDTGGVTVIDPNIDITIPDINIALNLDTFAIHLEVWAKTLISGDHFEMFVYQLGLVIKSILQFAMLPGLLIVASIKLINSLTYMPRNGTTDDISSYTVWGFKRINKALTPAYKKVKDFIKFYIDKYGKVTIYILMYVFNIWAILVTFFAYYVYFVYSIDFVSLYTQVINLIVDLRPLFPWWSIPIWLITGYLVFNKTRFAIARNRLKSFEKKNESAIEKELGVAIGIVGPQGSGKDVLSTYFSLSFEKIFKKRASSEMILIRSAFPDFPFRKLELELESLISSGKIVNKIQASNYVQKMLSNDKIYKKYDITKRKNAIYNGLQLIKIEDELADYAALFFIYTSASIVSNFQIRSDSFLVNNPGGEKSDRFPAYDFDWLDRNYKNYDKSVRSSVINFNAFRILKKFEIDNNDSNNMLIDSGVFVVSEIDKERGNRYSNQRRKGMDVNPENDGTKITGKLLRHLGSLRNYCYIRYIYNMQQFGALAGDENFIAETNIYIKKQKKEFKWAIPGWWIEPVLMRWIIERCLKSMEKHIHARNDITLRLYLTTRLVSLLATSYDRILNNYAYRTMDLSLSSPTMSGSQEDGGDMKIYLIRKIVFANRMKSDMMSGLFKEAKLKQTIGVNQLAKYQADMATIRELISQNGYFTTEIAQMMMDNYVNK